MRPAKIQISLRMGAFPLWYFCLTVVKRWSQFCCYIVLICGLCLRSFWFHPASFMQLFKWLREERAGRFTPCFIVHVLSFPFFLSFLFCFGLFFLFWQWLFLFVIAHLLCIESRMRFVIDTFWISLKLWQQHVPVSWIGYRSVFKSIERVRPFVQSDLSKGYICYNLLTSGIANVIISKPSLQRQHLFPRILPLKWISVVLNGQTDM